MPEVSSNAVQRFLHGKTAGLPNSVWIVIVGGAVAYGYYKRKHALPVGAENNGIGVASDGSTTVTGQAPAEFISAGVSAPTDAATPEGYLSNAQWAGAALKWGAVNHGASLFDQQKAITEYLSGTPMYQPEADYISAVIKAVGPPPSLPTVNTILSPPASPVAPPPITSSPTPTPVPRPVSPHKPPYVVKRGDTLSSIARKYGLSWQSLFNANRNKISNPNLIYPGQSIAIP